VGNGCRLMPLNSPEVVAPCNEGDICCVRQHLFNPFIINATGRKSWRRSAANTLQETREKSGVVSRLLSDHCVCSVSVLMCFDWDLYLQYWWNGSRTKPLAYSKFAQQNVRDIGLIMCVLCTKIWRHVQLVTRDVFRNVIYAAIVDYKWSVPVWLTD